MLPQMEVKVVVVLLVSVKLEEIVVNKLEEETVLFSVKPRG